MRRSTITSLSLAGGLLAAVAVTGCTTIRDTPYTRDTTDPTSISKALDRLTGQAECGEQRAVRAELLIAQLDQLAGMEGAALFTLAGPLAVVQDLERKPRARLQAAAAQLTLLALAAPYLELLDPRLQEKPDNQAVWLAALSLATDIGFSFGDIALAMAATPCNAEGG